MTEISIKKFSCIQFARIELKRLNVIIGPQGAGKSVTTKLIYFFSEILQEAVGCVEDGLEYSQFQKHLQKLFIQWFPPQAWGNERFLITFSEQDFHARVMRRKIQNSLSEEVTIKFSDEFVQAYRDALHMVKELRRASLTDSEGMDRHSPIGSFEFSWKIREEVWGIFREKLGVGLVEAQTFIPAGRAFFTSIGRLVAGIEHGGSLDPATLRFAKIFAAWRDQSDSRHWGLGLGNEFAQQREKIMKDLFGGEVQTKRESEFIEMDDGRRVPFTSLSSGQQELLPIWYFLDNILTMDAFRASRSRKEERLSKQLIYVEEPEAHLFPEAQSTLLGTMIDVVLGQSHRQLILTTHSPYIMTKLNVLLKAGQISKRKKKNRELNELVPRSRWLRIEEISALSIQDGQVKSIIDTEEGLIDAEFLDGISNSLSEQFLLLLDLEDSI